MKLLEVYKENPALLGSPLMVALFESLAHIPSEDRVVNPHIGGISITSDGYVVSGDHFLGSVDDLERNLHGLCAHFDAPDSEVAELMSSTSDWRTGGNAWS